MMKLFKNNYKKPGESSPDYRIYLSESPASQQAKQTNAETKEDTTENQQDSTDDIPF